MGENEMWCINSKLVCMYGAFNSGRCQDVRATTRNLGVESEEIRTQNHDARGDCRDRAAIAARVMTKVRAMSHGEGESAEISCSFSYWPPAAQAASPCPLLWFYLPAHEAT